MVDANPELQAKIKEIQEHVTEMETIHESCLEDESTATEEVANNTDEQKPVCWILLIR